MEGNLLLCRRQPKSPPSGLGEGDRAGIIKAITYCHDPVEGPLIAGGYSYGGRQNLNGDYPDARPR